MYRRYQYWCNHGKWTMKSQRRRRLWRQSEACGGEGQGPTGDAGGGTQGVAPGSNPKEKPVMHWWEKVMRLIKAEFEEM